MPTKNDDTYIFRRRAIAVAGNTEAVTNATNTALNPDKLFHSLSGATTPIATFTGGVEGQIAIILQQAASITVTHTNTDVANSVHMLAASQGNAVPADWVSAAGTTSLKPSMKTFLCTQFMPGFTTNLQWFEIAG